MDHQYWGREQQDSHYRDARFKWKGMFASVGWRCSYIQAVQQAPGLRHFFSFGTEINTFHLEGAFHMDPQIHSNFIRCLGRDQSTPRFFLFVFKSMEDLFVSWRTSLRSTCRLSTFPIKKNLLYFMLLWRPTSIGLLNFWAYTKGLSPSRLQPSN